MFEKLQKAKELYNLKKQSDGMKKEMEGIQSEFEEQGVRVVMRGDQQIMELSLDGEDLSRVKEVVNKASHKMQEKMAKKMQGRLGDLGIPGF
ncbi:MAG: hypothetical protein Q8N84_01000 [bacterium]|nr:hypothetical protein [bacterium]